MLLINASKGPSAIHGIGLIARQDIPKGTKLWEFVEGFDLEISAERAEKFPKPARELLKVYAIQDLDKGTYILSGDDDRFTNHSDDPNTRYDLGIVTSVRDISSGEEITADYRDFGQESPLFASSTV